ncbi:hypothetical protein ADL22_04420 [Streptomyces sp. NRRL F-4489]|uniref:hypothetical protein n=1 Tax=Streptomyces sp. NRRL F-4489 TaxID=1609095 RepID=UPI00074651DE|nr:hypothetical protein [Streptomyces sp. NRRL F-4489]KUL53144.1 hypothetical protein ADL22_04420 [Streptomyces sp. NRRL F-4489]
MQRGLVHAAAWTLATGAAVTLSWFGVHTVLSGTAYDAPRALPLSDQVAASALPQVSSTHRPKPSAPATARPSAPASPSASPGDDAPRAAAPSRTEPPAPPSAGGGTGSSAGGRVRGYTTSGGRVVLSLGPGSAELVSATPNAGWEMQVWKQDQWLRVDFTAGAAHTSVICTWNGHPPIVETSNRAT